VFKFSFGLPKGADGKDGQDGKFTEFRFAVNTSNSNPPTLNATVRTPSG
jgi:hypothetical protein